MTRLPEDPGSAVAAPTPVRPAAVRALPWPASRTEALQWAAAAVFVAVTALTAALQVGSSLDLVRSAGVVGAREGRPFLIVYAALAACVVGLAVVVPRRGLWLPVSVGALGLTVALVAVATFGGGVWSIAAALLTLASAWFLGRSVIGLPGLRESTLGESKLACLAAGFGVLGLIVLGLGLVGLLRWWTVGILLVSTGSLGLVRLAAGAGGLRESAPSLVSTRFRAGAVGLLGIQGAFAAIWAGAPDVLYDALQYKAWLPTLWASTGRIDAATFIDNPISVYLGLAQLVATPGHTVGAPGVGRFLQLLLAVLIVVVAWRIGSRVNPTVGPVVALVVGLTPMVVWQASTAYDDLFLTVLVLGAAAAVLHFEARRVTHPLAASAVVGFLGGTCLTGKLHLAPFLLTLFAVWCAIAESRGDFLRRCAGFIAGAAAAALPVLVFRWVTAGNPVFPFYNNVFKSSYFASDQGITDYASLTQSGLREGWSFFWHLLSSVPQGVELAAPGVFGLLPVAIVVAVLFGWPGDRHRRAVWGALAMSLILWWVKFRYVRFALPYGVLAALLAAPALGGLGRMLRPRAASGLGLVVAGIAAATLIVSAAASLWPVPGRFPLSAALGREPEAQYLRRALPDEPALAFLDERAAPGDGITGQVWGRLLLRRDLRLQWDWELQRRLQTAGRLSDDPDELRRELEAEGIRWIALADDGRAVRPDYFLAPVIEKYGQIVYADRLRDVYEIVDRPARLVAVELCDGSFTGSSCWFGAVLPDRTPGLTDAEVRGEPVGQTIPACPGATYALAIETAPGADPTRVFFVFDVPDPQQPFRQFLAPPGRVTVGHQTAPAGATKMTIVVDTLGPTAAVADVSLAVAGPSEADARCVQ